MNKTTIMRDLGSFSKEDIKLMNEKKIEFNKGFSKITNESKMLAKEEKCYVCGKVCSSFCNSHSIPASFLKNIDVNGKVFTNGKVIDLPILSPEKGVNQTGTFKIICRDCDSKIFSEYEDPDNYCGQLTPKMVSQIAMKNSLKNIAKRKFEIALYDNLPLGEESIYRQEISDLDLKEYIQDYEYAKKSVEKEDEGQYNIIFYKELDYVVPIAFQGNITLITDFEGVLINNIFNTNPKYKIKSLNVCVFPLANKSVIILFAKTTDKLYRNFRKQFNKLTLDDQLAAINYMIFSYSEDVFISKEIDETVLLDEALVAASRKSPEVFLVNTKEVDMEIVKESFSFSKMNDLPNLLSEQFKIR